MNIFDFIKTHKILMALMVAGLIIGGYFLVVTLTTAPTGDIQYQTARVKEGTITQTVSGSGQIEDVSQVSITAAASGKITKIYVGENETVAENDLLFQLDTEDYYRSLSDAKIDLEKAQLALQTLQSAPETSRVLQAEDAVQKARDDLTALRLRQKQERQTADVSQESAENNLARLNASDPDYRTQYEKYLTQLTATKQTLEELDKTGPAAISQAEAMVKEKQAALNELKAGATAEEIRSQELAVAKAQNNLSEIQSRAGDYLVRAPFSGIITAVNAEIGDSVSGGSSSAGTNAAASSLMGGSSAISSGSASSSAASEGLAILATGQKQAAIAVNEVDRPSLKIGQKAKITFNAIADLTLDGTVSRIDAEGATSSGVVTYGATVTLGSQDDRIANGMTVSAEITVAEAADVLVVSSAAVTTREPGQSYVEVLDSGVAVPRPVTVEVGLTNDTETEIISGLKTGDTVVIGETSANSSKSSTDNAMNGSSFREREGFMPMNGGRGGPPQ